jgi:hypothetical protein
VIVLTFDNLGEASELERGTWPAGQPLGTHRSVTRVLPRLLDELDVHGLRATFFVEAINCELYPDALHGIVARGHELGAHGWRHEVWHELAAERELDLLIRTTEAFEQVGLPVGGFRPPGGTCTGQTRWLLRGLNYSWCSPAVRGEHVLTKASNAQGLWNVGFDWELVDAYHLMERFADLRRRRGDSPEPTDPVALGDRFARRLPGCASGGLDVLILHPFLMLDESWFDQVRRLLGLLGELARTGAASVLPAGPLVASLAESTNG